jgi:hypothetical protein
MRLFEYRTAWFLVFVVVFYALLVAAVPYATRGTALRGSLLVLSGWGLVAYFPPFWRALKRRGPPHGGDLYAIMVVFTCASLNLHIAIAKFWRLSGQPYWIINNVIFDFWLVLASCAMGIAVMVPDLFGRDVPPRDKVQLGSVWLVLFVFVFWLVVSRPDMRPAADALRPWLDFGQNYKSPD